MTKAISLKKNERNLKNIRFSPLIYKLALFFTKCCTLLWLFVCPIFLFSQGPLSGFMPGKGNADIAIAFSYESFDEYFFGSSREQQELLINRSVNLFAEYGFQDSISLVVNLPYIQIDDLNEGLQDGSIFLKYRSTARKDDYGLLSLITAVGLSLPLSNYPVDTDTPIGLQATTIQGRFLVQYQLNSGLFFHLQSGLDFRISPTNQTAVPILGRTGYGSKKWYFELWAEYFHTFNSTTVNRLTTGEGSRWLRIGGTIFYNVSDQFGLLVGGARITDGENIGLSSRINIGAAYKIR